MNFIDLTKFDDINFDSQEVPSFIEETEKNYTIEMEKAEYILAEGQYNEFAARWARIVDYYGVQEARAEYLKNKIENEVNEIYDVNKPKAPIECKSDAAKKRWVQQTIEGFYKLLEKRDRSIGYYRFFVNKKESAKTNHYLCKNMSVSFNSDKGPGSF